MKLEKILERLNSLEKGPFVKVINNLIASQNKNSCDRFPFSGNRWKLEER